MTAATNDAATKQQQKAWTKQQAKAEADFTKARNAQASYAAALKALAKQVAHIIRHLAPEDGNYSLAHLMRIKEALADYAKAITPWAKAVAWRMLKEVHRRDLTEWQKYTRTMSVGLRQEIMRAPTGAAMQGLLDIQVDLITSLPTDAAQRVQELATGAVIAGTRYGEHAPEVQAELERAHPEATEAWLKNRATLIARTETARAQSVLMQVRAEHVGSDTYQWLTSKDWKVRPSHRRLQGSIQRWDSPPLSDPPDHHSHPGQIFNCRCIALPILPE